MSAGLNDRLGDHVGGEMSMPPQNVQEQQEPLIQRCVIIQRDVKGYGLTVSGDNPVYIQSVKEDGPADKAGVQKGDRIIKVNGTLVTQSNHEKVVEMIKSGTYVALTLLGRPPNSQKCGNISAPPSTLQPLNHSTKISSSTSERITGPQPVDSEKQHQLNNSRIMTIKKMLGRELVYMKNLESEFHRTPTEKIRAELNGAKKRIKTLEDQLYNLTGIRHDHNTIPRSPPMLRHCPSEKENIRASTGSSALSYIKSFTHQSSAPCLPRPPQQTSDHPPSYHHTVSFSGASDFPRPSSLQSHKMSLSTSLENLAKHFSSRTQTWPHGNHNPGQPVHSRQSSSPDASFATSAPSPSQPASAANVTKDNSVFKLAFSPQDSARHSKKLSASDLLFQPSESKRAKRKKQHQLSSLSSASVDVPLLSSQQENPLSDFPTAHTPEPHSPPPSAPILLSSDSECLDKAALSDPETFPEVCEESKVDGADQITAATLSPNISTLTNPKNNQFGTPPEGHTSPLPCPVQHPNIICMEEDDFSDSELGALDHHGPFNGLWKLVRHPAHLAVFIHYLHQNKDPSTLFFYLIAELMYEQGTQKEMKKWAYEIHSSFLVPGAPLPVKNIDDTILNEIDEILQHQLEKEEILKTVFKKAISKSKEELNDQLAEFRNTRTMGLGNFFGPSDAALEEAINDKTKELKIIESLLLPILESLMEDMDNASDRNLATAYALATVMKHLGATKSPACLALIERCPAFVAKEKTWMRILKTRKISQQVQLKGHQFQSQHYHCVTYCNHCQLLIWGVGNQGYHCQNCEINIHKNCLKVMEESCFGSLRTTKKDKKIRENWFGKNRKPSQTVPSAIENAKRLLEESQDLSSGNETLSDSGTKGKELSSFSTSQEGLPESLTSSSSTGGSGVGTASRKGPHSSSAASSGVQPPPPPPSIGTNNASAASGSIGRSESFRQRRESRPSFRKRSDPNIPRSKSDVEVEDSKNSNLNESGSSSNSSLSARSLDSPSNSIEMVHRTQDLSTSSTAPHYEDSDLEAEADPPDWQKLIDWEVLRLLKPKEKKRQDVINELFHTERTHVKNLKVLDKLFYRPLLQEQLLSSELLHLLFPNLDQMIEIHSGFNNKMKAKRREEALIGNVGEFMLEMMDGASGETLKNAAATFCRNQSIALEMLKQKQKKDQKVAQFLSDAEAHSLCRRLQLKDIIATGFQRLTKYPLLLENIAKHTPPNTEEHIHILQSVECSKSILAHVNQAVKETENQHRLSELQKKVDKSSLDKQYKNLDLTKHKMLYEGALTWRLNKQKSLEMHVVLLEEILLLFQRQDDKYVLKYHNTSITSGRDDTKVAYQPVLKVQNLFTRNVAVDKRGFFLVSTSEPHGAMYEFVASSAAERKNWLRHITEAIEASKRKDNIIPPDGQQISMETTEPIGEDGEAKLKSSMPAPPLSSIIQENPSSSLESASSTEEPQPPSSDALLSSGEEQSVPGSASSMEPLSGEKKPPDGEGEEEKNDATLTSPPSDQTNPTPTTSTGKSEPAKEEEKKPQRRLQRVEILQIADGPKLIAPSEVIIRQGATLQTAEPILTPLERLRRKDAQIAQALAEKEKLIADILQIPLEKLPALKEPNFPLESQMDVKELIYSAINQVNQLTSLLNESLKVTEEDTINASSGPLVPLDPSAPLPSEDIRPTAVSPKLGRRIPKMPGASPDKLRAIAAALNKQLTHLMALVKDNEEERRQLRKELHRSREQIHYFYEVHRNCNITGINPETGAGTACENVKEHCPELAFLPTDLSCNEPSLPRPTSPPPPEPTIPVLISCPSPTPPPSSAGDQEIKERSPSTLSSHLEDEKLNHSDLPLLAEDNLATLGEPLMGESPCMVESTTSAEIFVDAPSSPAKEAADVATSDSSEPPPLPSPGIESSLQAQSYQASDGKGPSVSPPSSQQHQPIYF